MSRQHDVILAPLTRPRDEPCPPEILQDAVRLVAQATLEQVERELAGDPRFAAEILELAMRLSARRAAESR